MAAKVQLNIETLIRLKRTRPVPTNAARVLTVVRALPLCLCVSITIYPEHGQLNFRRKPLAHAQKLWGGACSNGVPDGE